MGNNTSVLVKTIDLLNIADVVHENLYDLLYLPNIADMVEPILHYIPKCVWNIVEGIVGFD